MLSMTHTPEVPKPSDSLDSHLQLWQDVLGDGQVSFNEDAGRTASNPETDSYREDLLNSVTTSVGRVGTQSLFDFDPWDAEEETMAQPIVGVDESIDSKEASTSLRPHKRSSTGNPLIRKLQEIQEERRRQIEYNKKFREQSRQSVVDSFAPPKSPTLKNQVETRQPLAGVGKLFSEEEVMRMNGMSPDEIRTTLHADRETRQKLTEEGKPVPVIQHPALEMSQRDDGPSSTAQRWLLLMTSGQRSKIIDLQNIIQSAQQTHGDAILDESFVKTQLKRPGLGAIQKRQIKTAHERAKKAKKKINNIVNSLSR